LRSSGAVAVWTHPLIVSGLIGIGLQALKVLIMGSSTMSTMLGVASTVHGQANEAGGSSGGSQLGNYLEF